jgi:hypothetical protein
MTSASASNAASSAPVVLDGGTSVRLFCATRFSAAQATSDNYARAEALIALVLRLVTLLNNGGNMTRFRAREKAAKCISILGVLLLMSSPCAGAQCPGVTKLTEEVSGLLAKLHNLDNSKETSEACNLVRKIRSTQVELHQTFNECGDTASSELESTAIRLLDNNYAACFSQ